MGATSRQSNQIDVKDKGGSRTLIATPGNSVLYQLQAQQARIGAANGGPGKYNCVRAIIIECTATIVRLTGGATPIYADQFPRVISGIGLTTNLFGTLLDSTFVTGMVTKEILDFFGRGYVHDGINREPIPGADGTYVRTFEICIPFSQKLNDFPDDFAPWIGWLDESQLEIFVTNAAQPFGIAGVTITSCSFKCTLETIPQPNLIIPPYMAIRRYQQTASASSNGPVLVNVGAMGGLEGADDGARLDAMLFSHQVGGFIGSGTADQITQIAMEWRDQAVTQNINIFFDRFLAATGGKHRLGYTPSVTLAVGDNTNPYAMPNVAADFNPGPGGLADVSARYTPLVFQQKGSLISYMQKVKGNYPLDGMQFSADQTNQFVVYTRELKQWSLQKCSELLAAAQIDPAAVMLVPKLGRKNIKKVDASKVFCLPRQVVAKPKAA